MVITKLEILRERLKLYLRAERDILQGQAVEVEGMRLTRANLTSVRKMIEDLMNEIEKLEEMRGVKKRSRIRVVVPI